jgi:hypothetical protein
VSAAIHAVVSAALKAGKALLSKLGIGRKKDKPTSEAVKARAGQILREKTREHFKDYGSLQALMAQVERDLKPEGLKSLRAQARSGSPGKYDIVAEASPGDKVDEATVDSEEVPPELQPLVADIGEAEVKQMISQLGKDSVVLLMNSLISSTLHKTNLKASISKVGLADFIATVKNDGTALVIRYGVQALRKVGKADLNRAAAISGATISQSKLQAKWKHAADFGVSAPWKQKDVASHAVFAAAVNAVVSGASEVFVGPYHGLTWAAHFFQGGTVVITDLGGDFVSGWASAAGKLAGIQATAPPSGDNNFRVR